MTTRPWFKFYPKDWRGHTKLQLCSWAARGAWIEFMCLAHDSDEYGILRWGKHAIARAIGCPPRLIAELIKCGVIYGAESGLCDPLVYVPKSGRKEGPPVTLVEAQKGPIYFSPRMVKDEYLRQIRAQPAPPEGSDPPPQNPPPNPSPIPPFGEVLGDGLEEHQSYHPSDHPPSETESESDIRDITKAEASAIDPALRESARALVVTAAKQLRDLGMCDVHPHRPELLEALAAGATLPELTATAAELAERRHGTPPKLGYLVSTVLGRRSDTVQQPAGTKARGSPAAPRASLVTADFTDAAYAGTPTDELPPELR